MLDLSLLRRQPDVVRKGLADKGETADLDWFLQQDKDFRKVVTELNKVQARRNELTRVIGARKKAGEDASEELAENSQLKAREKHLTERKDLLEIDLKKILMRLPNLPADDVPVGKTPADNKVVDTWSGPPDFHFDPKPHWDLAQDLGMFHPDAAGRMSGRGFTLLSGQLAQLERALWSYMLDLHTREHGYTEVVTPYLVRPAALEGTGQLPKFEGDMYRLPEDDLFLVPTAEVTLTNIHRKQILSSDDLPIRYAGFSPCFRREAGAAGRDTRGLIRVHQFHKVELMAYTLPEDSEEELERIRDHAEAVLRALKLPYRVVVLCTGDLTFASRKTYDLEVWAPGVERWLEVSSVSNFGDFQARRAGIRFRHGQGKPRHVHTLNGSGLALPRVLVALLENCQREDGSIELPEVLRPYMGWKNEIR